MLVSEELLTVEEVAQRLKVKEETVRVWLRSGRLKGSRPGGKRVGWRVPLSEVDRLVGLNPER